MFKLYALIATAVGLVVYGVSTWATYDPDIRASRLYWVIGMAAAVIAHGLWTVLAQNLDTERRILAYALLWDAGFTAVSVLVPALLFRLRVSPVGYVGIFLIAVGGLLVKEYGFD